MNPVAHAIKNWPIALYYACVQLSVMESILHYGGHGDVKLIEKFLDKKYKSARRNCVEIVPVPLSPLSYVHVTTLLGKWVVSLSMRDGNIDKSVVEKAMDSLGWRYLYQLIK